MYFPPLLLFIPDSMCYCEAVCFENDLRAMIAGSITLHFLEERMETFSALEKKLDDR